MIESLMVTEADKTTEIREEMIENLTENLEAEVRVEGVTTEEEILMTEDQTTTMIEGLDMITIALKVDLMIEENPIQITVVVTVDLQEILITKVVTKVLDPLEVVVKIEAEVVLAEETDSVEIEAEAEALLIKDSIKTIPEEAIDLSSEINPIEEMIEMIEAEIVEEIEEMIETIEWEEIEETTEMIEVEDQILEEVAEEEATLEEVVEEEVTSKVEEVAVVALTEEDVMTMTFLLIILSITKESKKQHKHLQ